MILQKKYLFGCMFIVLMLCFSQIRGSTVLILGCMAAFLLLLGWCCTQEYTLPILLFFLPWSPLMRTNPASFSFFTLGMILACCISVLKKRFVFRAYHIVLGMLLAALTLLSKLLGEHGLEFSYIVFIMLIVLFPVLKEELDAGRYDFFHTVVFLATGIVMAALCAQRFASYGNIAKYISVHSYSTIVRRCGFYGDPNFYAAQITAALGGGLYTILKEKSKWRVIVLGVFLMLLLYCGFLSGSKSFVLVTILICVLWAIEMLKMKGKAGRKYVLLVFGLLAIAYIASSAIFGGLIDVLLTRFSYATNLSSFTTHRNELWVMYAEEILGNFKILFLGEGYTNVKVNERGSHNTIVQMIYQLGLLGTPVLIAWTVCFFQETSEKRIPAGNRMISLWMLYVGVFLPWLAIDILFFDEFFLFQWYVFVALKERNINLHTEEGIKVQRNIYSALFSPYAEK